MQTNKHGLSRTIPTEAKRIVRQRCAFGCARCAATIYEYEHFFPDFSDATSHDPAKIVLLCPTCHGLVTKGIIPKEQVEEFSHAPKARSNGSSNISLPFFRGIPSLKMGGGSLICETPVPIQISGKPLIAFMPPEDGSEVTRISLSLSRSQDSQMLRVIDNEWQILAGDWDFEWVGKRYIFRDNQKNVVLSLRIEPPDFIAIERFMSSSNGIPIEITEDYFRYGGLQMTGGIMSNCRVGISL